MSTQRLFSLSNRWLTTSVSLTAAVAVTAAVSGIILLPYEQPDLKLSGIWDAICSATGVPRATPGPVPPKSDFRTSAVVLTSEMLGQPDALSIGRGATLALKCAICHGLNGVSRADSPNLAGQYPAAIYKELADFRAGARVNAIMSPFAAVLTDQDMRDLAAYYDYLPRPLGFHPEGALPVPRIVINGAPIRNIAPCASCHGGLTTKVGSPWLEGQSPTYIKTQLPAFVTGARTNDISAQMRNVARQMTSADIEEAARYYGNQP